MDSEKKAELIMKIAIVHSTRSYGGATMGLLDVLSMLGKYETVVFIQKKGDTRIRQSIEKVGVRTIEYTKVPPLFAHYSGSHTLFSFGFWKGLTNVRNLKWWYKRLAREDASFVLLNSSVLSLFGKILCKKGFKVICYDRETHNMCFFGLPDRITKQNLDKIDAVIFLSQYEKRHFALTNTNIVIPDILNEALFRDTADKEACRKTLGLGNNDFVLLFVGGISELKGTYVILKAMESLEYEDIKLLILGDTCISQTKYAKKCNGIINNNKNILNIGLKMDLSLYYKASDLLVFPSTKPHQARPVLEAGYYGRAAIVSDFPETRDYMVCGKNVCCVPPNDPLKLEEAILKLYDDRNYLMKLSYGNKEMTAVCHNYHTEKEKLNNVLHRLR